MLRILKNLVVLSCLLFPGLLLAETYAEVMVGVVSPTGLSRYRDPESQYVKTGTVGTTLTLDGLFQLNKHFALSPSYSYLSTGGSVDHARESYLPSEYDIKFQQNELGVDALWTPPGTTRFRFGPGMSAVWWFASEKIDHPLYAYDNRVTRGQSFLARGVAHLMLRAPGLTGFSLKFIAAVPLTQTLKIKNAAATGYVGVSLGFSMVVL